MRFQYCSTVSKSVFNIIVKRTAGISSELKHDYAINMY